MNCLKKKLACVFMHFCIIHGSGVLGNDQETCEEDTHILYQKYDNNNPFLNFEFGLIHYNDRYFINERNFNALGYFKELSRDIRTVNVYLRNLNECKEAIYILLSNKGNVSNRDKARIDRMSESEVLIHVYRKIIYSRIPIGNYFPNVTGYDFLPPQNEQDESSEGSNPNYSQDEINAALANLSLENDRRRRLTTHMQEYFTHLVHSAGLLTSYIGFPTVQEYCASIDYDAVQGQENEGYNYEENEEGSYLEDEEGSYLENGEDDNEENEEDDNKENEEEANEDNEEEANENNEDDENENDDDDEND